MNKVIRLSRFRCNNPISGPIVYLHCLSELWHNLRTTRVTEEVFGIRMQKQWQMGRGAK